MDWQVIVPALITGLLGGGLSATVVSFWLKTSREDRLKKEERLEAVLDAFRRHTRALHASWGAVGLGLMGKATFQDVRDHLEWETEAWRTLEATVSLYFPDLQPLVQRLRDVKEQGGEIVALFLTQRAGGDAAAFKKLARCGKDLEDLEDDFVEAVRREAAAAAPGRLHRLLSSIPLRDRLVGSGHEPER